MIFLVAYDRRKGKLESLRSFDASERKLAQEARLELEISLKDIPNEREIVLLDAASEDALRKTHRRYFENAHELVLSGSTTDIIGVTHAPTPREPSSK